MSPLKLVTMTIDADINTHINLDVIARYTPLDERITEIRYRNIHRTPVQGAPEDDKEFYKSETGSGRFKNQCTFIIDVGDKKINTKVFNNGKIVNVGCKKVEHAEQTSEILIDLFQNMKGLVIYTIPDTFPNNNIKKFFKDDLRKKYGKLIPLLTATLELELDTDPFSGVMSSDEGYATFQRECENPRYISDIMYVHTIIRILKCYFEEGQLVKQYDNPDLQAMLKTIQDHTDRDAAEISCVFPSYLNNDKKIPFDKDTIEVVLINKSTNCGYFLNRTVLEELITDCPGVLKCTYDKNRYPGVITAYQTPTWLVKIIVFNTGKINITKTRTHEQVQQAYDFISEFCREHFHELLLRSEYTNRQKESEDNMPAQFHVGLVDDQQIYLLKKSSIISNPRNVRFLSKRKLLSYYR